jgi:peptidoglycan/LPS O-acetylase OafA/YrhL
MRNRYLDLLRAVAIVRVVVYHVTGWSVLTIVFPAMSVMFALAGSMMAASLDRTGPFAVERRLRRLLPALWLVAAIAIPSMIMAGHAWDWNFLLWGFPLQDPPATGYWMEALSATWYLRDFLWFVLLSPLALPVFRRFPLLTPAVPYVALVVIDLAGLRVNPILHDAVLYGGPWLLGFAHHDGLLRDLGRRRLLTVAGACAAAGAVWFTTHPGPRGLDLNDIPIGNALWSAAFVLVLLGFTPMVRPNRVIAVLNARALTIYLWHVPALVAVEHFAVVRGWPLLGWAGSGWRLPVVCVLVAAAVLLAGWVEDVSAGRRATLIPAIVGPREQDGRHDIDPRPAHVLRPRVREHAGGIPDLGREHDLSAGRGAEQLPGIRG